MGNLYTSKQLKDIVIIPDVHIYKYILVSQTSWVVQQAWTTGGHLHSTLTDTAQTTE